MKRIFISSLLALFVCLSGSVISVLAFQSTNSQSPAKPTPTPSYPLIQLRRDFKDPLPIPAGETLEYEVKYSRFPIPPATVGMVTFEYLGALPTHNSGNQTSGEQTSGDPSLQLIKGLNIDFKPSLDEKLLQLRASAISKGIILSILGVDIKNRYETLVDAHDFSAKLSFQENKEGKKHIVQSAVFDQAMQQVKYLTTDLTKPDASPRAKFLPLQDGMMSLLSAFYIVRLQKFKEGHMLRLPVSTDEQNYQIDIIVGKNEKIKTDCGKVKAIRLEPQLFGPGRLFSRQGEMYMWVRDDSKHTPLRLMAKTSSGTITAKLLNYKKNCQIADPEIEDGTRKAQKTR